MLHWFYMSFKALCCFYIQVLYSSKVNISFTTIVYQGLCQNYMCFLHTRFSLKSCWQKLDVHHKCSTNVPQMALISVLRSKKDHLAHVLKSHGNVWYSPFIVSFRPCVQYSYESIQHCESFKFYIKFTYLFIYFAICNLKL